MDPGEVNQLADDVIAERVRVVSTDPSAKHCDLPALVPFATYGLVFRVHEEVARLNNASRLPWGKQPTVARVLASITGVAAKNRQESEYIGNAVDARLRHYCRDMLKAKASDKKSMQRARKRGQEPPSESRRVKLLQEQLYVCQYGGTPLKVPVVNNEPLRCRPLPINRQNVPFRVSGLDEVLVDYKRVRDELADASRERPSKLHALERDTRNAIREAERAQQHFEAAEEQAVAAAAIMRLAAVEAKGQAEKSKEMIKKSELKSKEQEGDMLRLQGHLVRALRQAEDVDAKRQRSEAEASRAIEAMRADIEAARGEAAKCKERVRVTAQLCSRKEGEVLIMEGKLVRACQEAYEEQCKRMRVAELAEEERLTMEAELDLVRAELTSYQQQLHQAKRETHLKDGEVLRLQGKLGQALQEAAIANNKVESVRVAYEKKQSALQAQLQRCSAERLRARQLKNVMARRLRELNSKEENAEAEVTELHRYRQRVRALNKEVNALRAQLASAPDDESAGSQSEVAEVPSENDSDYVQQDDTHSSSQAAANEALERMRNMPEWRAVRGKGAGKGAAKIEWRVRLVIYAFLALMVPVSAVGMAIVMVVKLTAPWLRPTAPTYETVERCRFEYLRFLEEAVSARRMAGCYKVRMLGFDETTKFGMASLTTSVTIEPTPGAELEDVVLRAAYCPLGGTSDLCVQSIERRCCARLRDHLRRWEAQFRKMFPGQEWTGPDANQCSLHRLGGGGAIMSDTCNSARCAKRLLSELVAQQVEDQLGADHWGKMSEDERNTVVRTHQIDCWGHIRNIFLEHMSKELAVYVKAELQPELETFSAWERMSTEYAQLVRACYKEFHHGCRYYKGKGRPYAAWLRENHPTAFVMHLERTRTGRWFSSGAWCDLCDHAYNGAPTR